MKLSIFQFVPTGSSLVSGHDWEEPGSVVFISPHGAFLHTGKIAPEPSLLQAQQPQLSQLFLMWEML